MICGCPHEKDCNKSNVHIVPQITEAKVGVKWEKVVFY